MKRKTIILTAIILIGVFVLISITVKVNLEIEKRNDSKRIENGYAQSFKEYEVDFERINSLLIDATKKNVENALRIDKDGRILYGTVRDKNKKIVSIHNFPLELTDSCIDSLNRIDMLLNGDLRYIYVNDKRIDYSGNGNKMYVFATNKEKPQYFFDKDDDTIFSTYELSDNWYYLVAYMR